MQEKERTAEKWLAIISDHTVSCGLLFTCSPDHVRRLGGNPTMAFMFENLAVYQKAVDFAEQIVTLTESFPAATSSFPTN